MSSLCVCREVNEGKNAELSMFEWAHTLFNTERSPLFSTACPPFHPSYQATLNGVTGIAPTPNPPNHNPAPSRPLRSGQRRLFFTASSSFSLRPQSSLSNEQPLFCHFLPLSSFSFAVTAPTPRPPDWNLTQNVNIWTDYDLFFLTTVPQSFYVHSSFYSLVFFRLKTPG